MGSTGSIGTQVLDVARLHNIKIKALSAETSVKLLERQAREFAPQYVCAADESKYKELKLSLKDTDVKVLCGKEGLCQLASLKCDTTVNAIVGTAGFAPTLAAVKARNDIALANKETLVVGGEIIIKQIKEKKVRLLPIDSEHSAIFQCLMGKGENKFRKILLTASGGPFRGFTKEQLKTVNKSQALKHPNWSMGAKITIDSATMMNKGLELIEAVWLFGATSEQVEIIIHPQSILHSAVEFEDGSVIGQLGVPDMRIPIQLALTYPKRVNSCARSLSLTEIGSLTFEKPNNDVFPCMDIARSALKKGGNMPCIINKANEISVKMFLEDKIGFWEIPNKIRSAMESVKYIKEISPEIIFETERETEEYMSK
ncbi:MAG: 1-deoxy-D-xylulose-5-phosphate reductoisomerase [Firmicutes bacterium]|nr:1-deoxy-D-xylulose-5-phosphate reductoisomerase [[Eubacterium] siraeum]MCM1489139.1 1-deoxy-D-xylulose-5-phosphate reductoisomerase [Bacillota bacterium]